MIDLTSWIDNAHSYLIILRQEAEARGDLDAYPLLCDVIEQYADARKAAMHAPLAFAVALESISGSRAAEVLGISINEWRSLSKDLYEAALAYDRDAHPTTLTATESADEMGPAQSDPR